MEQLSFVYTTSSSDYTPAELALFSPDDIYKLADESLLVRLKEDRRLERKSAGTHPGELGEYYCMWANTAGNGGLVVLGQNDDP